MTTKKHKLGVIVPYRNRYDHLLKFKRSISDYLELNDIDHVLIVVEQDDAKLFNRGKLLNVGFLRAVKEGCDYVVFHDVDMIPIKVDYSYSDVPIHLATDLISGDKTFKRQLFDSYFGGVTLFPITAFQLINGYSNDYWGWGFEDDDLFKRCIDKGVPHDVKMIHTEGGSNVSLRFNGFDSYVKTKFTGNLKDKTTIVVNVDSDGITCDPEQPNDRYTILSIPSMDFSISYDSFRRYKVLFKQGLKDWFYLDSEIIDDHKTTLAVSIDNITKNVKFYENGKLIGKKKMSKPFSKTGQTEMFIGSKDGKKELYKGDISYVAVYDKILTDREILEVTRNQTYSLTMSFGDYKSDGNLVQYYDMKFIRGYKLIDLCDFDNEAQIIKCEIIKNEMVKETPVKIPFRKHGYFDLLSHGSSGYDGGVWSDINIRYNQLRFHNEMEKGYRDYSNDGLSNCDFKVWDETKIKKQIHMVVSI